MPKEMQEVELKLDLPQSTLPTSKITIENGSGSTVVVKPTGLKVRSTFLGSLLVLFGFISFAIWLGLSVRAYQDTMAAITALQVTMPSPRTALLVVIIILPVTYPVVLCLATWILRWRERIRARRDELGDLGYVRTFLLCGSIVMWLICAAVMLVVLGLSAYAMWGGLMFTLEAGSRFWLTHVHPSVAGFKMYAAVSDEATSGLGGLIKGFDVRHGLELPTDLKAAWTQQVVVAAANMTVPSIYTRPACPVYCFDLSNVTWIEAANSCVCDSKRLADALPLAQTAWQFVLGAWLALLVMYISGGLLALLLATRSAATRGEKKFMKSGKRPAAIPAENSI